MFKYNLTNLICSWNTYDESYGSHDWNVCINTTSTEKKTRTTTVQVYENHFLVYGLTLIYSMNIQRDGVTKRFKRSC